MKMLLDLTPKNRLIRSQLCTVVTGKDGMCHLSVSRVRLLLYLLRRLDNRCIVCNPKAQHNDYVFFFFSRKKQWFSLITLETSRYMVVPQLQAPSAAHEVRAAHPPQREPAFRWCSLHRPCLKKD